MSVLFFPATSVLIALDTTAQTRKFFTVDTNGPAIPKTIIFWLFNQSVTMEMRACPLFQCLR
ncbi:MAG TPA: hypothetical protein VJ111_06810 [Chitinophagaceae bacterium]|nr:hypothetical protein [Chitinophagaceae bacterium]